MCSSTFFLPDAKSNQENSNNMKFFFEGFSYIIKNEIFYIMILLTYLTNFFIFGYIQALPAFIDLFDGTPTELGLMFSSA